MGFKCGIVGLPNVGKSTLFKALTKSSIPAENFPFCTIEPNIGKVPLPDKRLKQLNDIVNSKKIIPANIAYTDLKYRQVISLTGIYQGGIILWVAFWCFYGQGFNQETFYNVGVFSLAYSTVIGIECLLDVGLLATFKSYKKRSLPSVFNQRLISVKD